MTVLRAFPVCYNCWQTMHCMSWSNCNATNDVCSGTFMIWLFSYHACRRTNLPKANPHSQQQQHTSSFCQTKCEMISYTVLQVLYRLYHMVLVQCTVQTTLYCTVVSRVSLQQKTVSSTTVTFKQFVSYVSPYTYSQHSTSFHHDFHSGT